MQGKFRFSLDGADATARRFADINRQLHELPGNAGRSVGTLGRRVTAIEEEFQSLASGSNQADAKETDVVVSPSHGGTGVRNTFDNPLSLAPGKPVYCLHDGTLGADCSTVHSVTGIGDADMFISLGALRQVKWRVYRYKDDLNQRLDDAQPIVGLLAEELDDAGLGSFCEYDMDGVPTGVDYSRLSIAALRLAQEAMDEVDGLKDSVAKLSSEIDKMEETYVRKSTVGE